MLFSVKKMNFLPGICFFLFVNLFQSFFCVESQQTSLPEFREIFYDDFNGHTIDTTLWSVANVDSSGSYAYRSYNVEVQRGHLHLRAQKGPIGVAKYTSSRIDINETFAIEYGEVEVRARTASGKLLWSAIGLENLRCTPVICPAPKISILDVHEGREGRTEAIGNARSMTNLERHDDGFFLRNVTGFHTHKLRWVENKVTWYVDHQEIFSTEPATLIPWAPLKMFLSLTALEGIHRFPGEPPSSSRDFVIDYVKVSELNRAHRRVLEDAARVITTGLAVGATNLVQNGTTNDSTKWTAGIIIVGCVLAAVVTVCGVADFLRRKLLEWRRSSAPSVGSFPLMQTESNAYYHYIAEVVMNPYFRHLEIPSKNLIKNTSLGQGHFGTVWKGLLKSSACSDRKRPEKVVAIKTFLDVRGCDIALAEKLFLEEMKIMIKVGQHLNIVNFLGAVTVEKPILMVMEYCPGGSLLGLLKSSRTNFVNCVRDDGSLDPADHLKGRRRPSLEQVVDTSSPTTISTDSLVHYSFQITRGLNHLASRSIIHGDLAARNILVCDPFLVKISDFGLAKERNLAEYIRSDQAQLPVKWMAPESLSGKVFSHKSDIWSLGVLFWEIFSLGEVPFKYFDEKGAISLAKFLESLTAGVRMERPCFSPSTIYGVMLRCWQLEKSARPTAAELVEELATHLQADCHDVYAVLDDPYERHNAETAL